MVDTWSSKPFISYDGKDERGIRAEVRVLTGFGVVEKINDSKKGKARQAFFLVDNNEHPISGWTPNDSVIIPLLEAAVESGEPVHFRIEFRRQAHVDRSIPLDEVAPPRDMAAAKDNMYRSLVGVKREGDEEWTLTDKAVTRLDEDPVRGGLYSAQAQPKETPAAGGAGNSYSGGSSREAQPWVLHNRDGSLNMGSTAVSVPITFLSYVSEWDRNHTGLDQVGERKWAVVAKVLVTAANRLQVEANEGWTEPDLTAGSHTRARALIFMVIETYYPLNSEIAANQESLTEWRDNLVNKALAIWKWSAKEVTSIIG